MERNDWVAIYRNGSLMTVVHRLQLRPWMIDNLFLTSKAWSGGGRTDEALITLWRGYGVTFRPCKTKQAPILEKMFHNDKK